MSFSRFSTEGAAVSASRSIISTSDSSDASMTSLEALIAKPSVEEQEVEACSLWSVITPSEEEEQEVMPPVPETVSLWAGVPGEFEAHSHVATTSQESDLSFALPEGMEWCSEASTELDSAEAVVMAWIERVGNHPSRQAWNQQGILVTDQSKTDIEMFSPSLGDALESIQAFKSSINEHKIAEYLETERQIRATKPSTIRPSISEI